MVLDFCLSLMKDDCYQMAVIFTKCVSTAVRFTDPGLLPLFLHTGSKGDAKEMCNGNFYFLTATIPSHTNIVPSSSSTYSCDESSGRAWE